MARYYGMLCFCRSWHNPVLWSHYSDKHQGICVGFEVDKQSLRPVSYVKNRTPLRLPATHETMEQLLFTKYRDWSYEEELRGWFRLEQRDASTGHYFYGFDEKIQLREVIAGPLCGTPRATIEAALKGYEDHIRIVKARLAFTTFKVIKNLKGFRWRGLTPLRKILAHNPVGATDPALPYAFRDHGAVLVLPQDRRWSCPQPLLGNLYAGNL